MTDTEQQAPAPGEHAASRSSGSFFRELPFLILVAFGLALLIKTFLIQAFFIPSGSMENTLQVRDRVLVNKLVYDFREVHRGEVVVFDGEDSFTEPDFLLPEPGNALQGALRSVGQFLGVGAPGEKDFIKRVIAVGGDRVACCTDGQVTVQPEGSDRPVQLVEPYVFEDNAQPFCEAGNSAEACPPGAPGVLVPADRLWMMGDHRCCSSDSRANMNNEDNGTVAVDRVIGRAFVIVWPVGNATVLGVPQTFDGPFGPVPAALVATTTPYALGVVGALPLMALRRRLRARSGRHAAA